MLMTIHFRVNISEFKIWRFIFTSALEGSISIPLGDLSQESYLKFIQKKSLNKEVFTICKSGKRSEKASRILSKFKIKSRSIEGGIEKVKKILWN